jgi:hypothetical protein
MNNKKASEMAERMKPVKVVDATAQLGAPTPNHDWALCEAVPMSGVAYLWDHPVRVDRLPKDFEERWEESAKAKYPKTYPGCLVGFSSEEVARNTLDETINQMKGPLSTTTEIVRVAPDGESNKVVGKSAGNKAGVPGLTVEDNSKAEAATKAREAEMAADTKKYSDEKAAKQKAHLAKRAAGDAKAERERKARQYRLEEQQGCTSHKNCGNTQ